MSKVKSTVIKLRALVAGTECEDEYCTAPANFGVLHLIDGEELDTEYIGCGVHAYAGIVGTLADLLTDMV